ncbi:hypothetical protein H311_01784 [Anncaliia algerae PRA109]|nr:hypothetical protein H311_01784 [Anncaliia algerae PRA109]
MIDEQHCYAKILEKFKNCNNMKVICIQGPSASGKSTLSDAIRFLLRTAGKNVFVLNIDNFYRTKPKNNEYYDFDNPGTILWDKVYEILQAFDNKEDKLNIYRYSFQNAESTGPIQIDNKKPEYLIIEGLFAHYLFADHFFDTKNVTPQKRLNEIENSFVKNTFKFNNFSVLKIALTISKDKLLDVRLKRDTQKRKKNIDLIKWQVNEQVWPATEKWIYKYEITKPDLVIDNGSFNFDDLIVFKKGLIKFWKLNENYDTNFLYRSPYTIPSYKESFDI